MHRSLVRSSTLVIALIWLGACAGGPATLSGKAQAEASEADVYVAFQSLLNESPSFRQGFVRSCSLRLRQRPRIDRVRMAEFLSVPEPFMETEFCTRVANLVAAGRLTLRDLEALRSPETDPRTMERLLKLIIDEPGAGTWI